MPLRAPVKLASVLTWNAVFVVWAANAAAQPLEEPTDPPVGDPIPDDSDPADAPPDGSPDSPADRPTDEPEEDVPSDGSEQVPPPDTPTAAPPPSEPPGPVRAEVTTSPPGIVATNAAVDAPPEESKPLKRGGLVFEDVAGIDGLDFNPTGQYMARFRHFEGHDFVSGGNANTLRHRARLGMGLVYADMVGGLVQVQDVRIFGEERNTLGDFSGDGLDMHQAYLRVMPIEGLELRLGRQEIAFENHRLIGTVAWIEQARSFDALRVTFDHDYVRVDGFYAKVAERDSPTVNPDCTPFHERDLDVLAGNVHVDPIDELRIGIVAVGDIGGATNTDRITVGGLAGGRTSFGLGYGVEGYYQYGDSDGDVGLRAYMAGGHLGYWYDESVKPWMKAFGEVLSGDSDPADDTQRSFNTLFHTGHKFYGEMDYFLNLPVDTQQRGLVDVGGAAGLTPVKPLTFSVTYHHFRASADQGDGLQVFGHELDTMVTYTPVAAVDAGLRLCALRPGRHLRSRPHRQQDRALHLLHRGLRVLSHVERRRVPDGSDALRRGGRGRRLVVEHCHERRRRPRGRRRGSRFHGCPVCRGRGAGDAGPRRPSCPCSRAATDRRRSGCCS